MAEISNMDDVIDSSDVIERIGELEAIFEENGGRGVDVAEELDQLRDLARQGAYAPDWEYGCTLIRDSYFTEYAQELADDLGLMGDKLGWPYTCIDWEQAARELQRDYTAVDFDGVTYWVR